jgi:NAD-dependent dihydropyrimidine dehydrogenase PreA subunit
MPTIIRTDLPLCIGCYKCVRVCPVETANVTYLDSRERLKVRVDQSRCVRCGACLEVCPRGARHYLDDTDLMIKRLEAGDRISVMVSPHVKGNVAEYRRVLGLLKSLGVRSVFSLSLGLEIHVWASLRVMARRGGEPVIASYCPALVAYIESQRPELVDRLSQVISPASALALVLESRLGLEDDLAVISACLAETGEPDRPYGRLRYSLSFSRLRERLLRLDLERPDDEVADFDEIPLGLGPTSEFGGGFLENVSWFLGPEFRGDRLYGSKGLEILDEYVHAGPELLPGILDLALCEGGCVMGPGRVPELKRLEAYARLHEDRRSVQDRRDRALYEGRAREFDETLKLEEFLRERHPSALVRDHVPDDRIKEAFAALNKTTTAQKTVDCFACGSRSCFEMARKVALGVNLPSNCLMLAKEQVTSAGRKMVDFLQLVRLIGEYMLASGLGDLGSTIEHSLMALCSALDISRASLWQATRDPAETPSCSLLLSFPARTRFQESVITPELLPGWLEALADGDIIVKSYSDFNNREKLFFSGRDLGVLAMVPIMAQGDFWGAILIARRLDQYFTDEEISVVESSAFIIISSLISTTGEDGPDGPLQPLTPAGAAT